MDLLLTQNRIDDAIVILQTCHKLDPYNGQISDWIDQLSRSKSSAPADQVRAAFSQVQRAIDGGQTNSALQILDTVVNFGGNDPATLLGAADMYLRLGSSKSVQLLDRLLSNPNDDPNVLMELANRYLRVGDMVKSEQAVQRLAAAMPNNSEPLYNLAVIQSHRGEIAQAVASLKKCLTLNAAEIAKNPKMFDLRQHLFQDPNFAQLRQTPEFTAAIGTKP
jgi:Flp pilus assembly protein TadD